MRPLLLLTLCSLVYTASAQKLELKNYSLGFRSYEMEAVGNNPLTIGPLLKDTKGYEDFIRAIDYNSLFGAPGIQKLQTLYVNAEWGKPHSTAPFWKRQTLQAGLLITGRLVKDGMRVGTEEWKVTTDTVKYQDLLSVVQRQQFVGANVGLNRRFRLSRSLSFVAGVHVQGSVAGVHRYALQWDSATFSARQGWQSHTTPLPDRRGRHFFQWQAGVPLGFELNLYQQRVFLRPELALGIIGSKYRPRSSNYKECHGFGVWLLYAPARTSSARPRPAS